MCQDAKLTTHCRERGPQRSWSDTKGQQALQWAYLQSHRASSPGNQTNPHTAPHPPRGRSPIFPDEELGPRFPCLAPALGCAVASEAPSPTQLPLTGPLCSRFYNLLPCEEQGLWRPHRTASWESRAGENGQAAATCAGHLRPRPALVKPQSLASLIVFTCLQGCTRHRVAMGRTHYQEEVALGPSPPGRAATSGAQGRLWARSRRLHPVPVAARGLHGSKEPRG